MENKKNLDQRLFTVELMEKLIQKIPKLQTKILTADLVGCIVVGQLMHILDAFPVVGDTFYSFKSFVGYNFLQRGFFGSSTFSHCDLSKCKMASSKLCGVRFVHTHCRDALVMCADLRCMYAHRSDFIGTDFTAAHFEDSDISSCDFGRVLQEAKNMKIGEATAIVPSIYGRSVLNKCMAIRVHLRNVSFQYCDLTDTVWTESKWYTVDASHSSCGGSAFRRVVFVDCDFKGVDFTGSDFTDARFEGRCNLRSTCFMCCTLAGTFFDVDNALGVDEANFTCAQEDC